MAFSPTTVTGTAVLEYGPTETLPQVGALSKHAERLSDPVAKPAAHTRAESRGSGPSKVDAAERQTLCWREMDSNFRYRVKSPVTQLFCHSIRCVWGQNRGQYAPL